MKGRYRHFKGGIYEVVGVGFHTETKEQLVFYHSESGDWYARPLGMFTQTVEHLGKRIPRFTLLKAMAQAREDAIERAKDIWGLESD